MYMRIPTLSILHAQNFLEELVSRMDRFVFQRCGGLKVWVISEDAVDPERFLDELGPSKVTSRDQIQWIEMAGFHQKHLLTKACGTDGDSGAVNAKGVVEGRPKFFLHHCNIPLKRSLHLHPGFQYSTSRKDRKR